MANFGNTTKWALRKLLGTSDVREIDDGFAALADDVDPLLTPFTSGVLASRPVSTPGSPGKAGREYYATDTGELYKDHGTGWIFIATNPIPSKLLKPTKDVIRASGNVALGTSWTDIPGATVSFTPAVPSVLLVTFSAVLSYSALDSVSVTPTLDGTPIPNAAATVQQNPAGGSVENIVLAGVAKINVSAAAHTLKLQGSKVLGTTQTVLQAGTGFMYELIAQ